MGKSTGKKAKKVRAKFEKLPFYTYLSARERNIKDIVSEIEDQHVVEFLSKIRSRFKSPKEDGFPFPILEMIRYIGGTGLGMSRRFSQGELVMLPSGHKIPKMNMDANEIWANIPYLVPEEPKTFFMLFHGAKVKEKGTYMPPDIKDYWVRMFRRKINREHVKNGKITNALLSKFRQSKTQKNFFNLAISIGRTHAMFRGWKHIKAGTEVAVNVKDISKQTKEIGARDVFLYGRPEWDGDRYEGINIEIESRFTPHSLKKILYGLIKSVNIHDPKTKQTVKVDLVHNIIVTPEEKLDKRVKKILKLDEWERMKHEIDGIFDLKYMLSKMEIDKSYLYETLSHLLDSEIHRKVLDEDELKIIKDTLEDLKSGREFPERRWEEIRKIITKINKANLDRLTIDFNVYDYIVDYVLGKKVKLGDKEIEPKHSSFLQYNALMYFFSRGFKGDIKESVLKEILKDENREKLLQAIHSGKIDGGLNLDINPVVMKEVLDNMAKHMRKALQNTVFYLTDPHGREVRKIVIFKKDPIRYRLYPVIITPENKDKLVYRESLEHYREYLEKKIERGEPITDISHRHWKGKTRRIK